MTDREFDDAARLEQGGGNIFAEDAEQRAGAEAARADDADDDEGADAASEPQAEADAHDDELGPLGPGFFVRYDGGDFLDGVPSREEIVAECSAAITPRIAEHIEARKDVFFMPTDVEEINEYGAGIPSYALRLFGAMMDGSKAEVIVEGIEVFFDVAVAPAAVSGGRGAPPPSDMAFEAHLRGLLTEAGVNGFTLETVFAFPVRGYHVAPQRYKRVRTYNLQARKKAIEAVRAAGMSTASDDRSSYYRKAARELGLPLSDWAVLSEYDYAPGFTDESPLCAHRFRVPATRYRPIVDSMADKAKREAATRIKSGNAYLVRDRTLVLAWDIETHSGRGTGDLPLPEHDADTCFMISMSAHWKDEPEALRRICIVDVDAAPDSKWTTVVCGNQTNVLKAFALCWKALAPDIVIGFNDSGYDWPFVVKKAEKLKVLGWMFERMTAAPRRKELSSEDVMKWNYAAEKKIKISAEAVFFSSFLKTPGCVPIDVRACFKKLFPKNETQKAGSLKFYLEVSDLPGKADMPITTMWRSYEGARAASSPESRELMRHVSHYCVVDAVRCQQLMVRRNVINDYREVSSLAFVSLFDAHYYAGGMKVCNLLGAYAWRRNILISMIPMEGAEQGKYPGAYVFPPEKGIVPDPQRLAEVDEAAAGPRDDAGRERIARALANLEKDRPVTGLDYSSLYPSLIMAYNLSPEKIVTDADEAARLREVGKVMHGIEFPFNGRSVRGWAVRHGNVACDIGLYPAVLIDLFAKRAEMKVELGTHGATKELLEVAFGRSQKEGCSVAEALRRIDADAREEIARTEAYLGPEAPTPRLSPGSTVEEEVNEMKRLNRNAREMVEEIRRVVGAAVGDAAVAASVNSCYAAACFNWTRANTKQNALKVYMNTFYGEAGNSLSPFFLLQLAGGVTSAGQYNIKMVAEFVRSKGFGIKYGDTDSLYLVAPSKYFAECDEEYVAGRLSREDWMSAMVRITMRALNQIRDEVNAYLRSDNGTGYLKMAYEEVLFPVVFTGKKKYFGIPHLNEVNFRPKKMFVRGIDVVKQGQPGLAREIGYRIMWACMALDNSRGLLRIVQDVLQEAVLNSEQWGFDHFVKTDAWKPDKRNIPVQRFIARMASRSAIEVAASQRAIAAGQPALPYVYEMPEPGERFSYVIVKKGAEFDFHGLKSTLGKGDRMEFAKVARESGLEIDVAYYMISHVVGLCARFINGSAEFLPPHNDRHDEKRIDELSQQAAKKYLESFIKGLGGIDSATLRKRGYAYRRAYKAAAAETRGALVERVGVQASQILHGDWVDFSVFGGGEEDSEAVDSASRIISGLWAAAEGFADRLSTDEWCEELGRKLGIDPRGLDIAPGAAGARAPGASATSANLHRATAGRGRRPPVRVVTHAAAATLGRLEADTRASLVAQLPEVSALSMMYEASLLELVERRRADEHEANPDIGVAPRAAQTSGDFTLSVPEQGRVALERFRRTWLDAVGVALVRRQSEKYADYLRRLKSKRAGVVTAPTRVERAAAIADAASKYRSVGGIADGI